ncbi:hypothetical protein LJR289_004596 [Pseudoduganella sp. LjRoot289]|uniref:hypothetical protein n=1 Tax=Pseudoduganella sp. LjRoot289 TaxID=3342314 RepID=UPI003ED133D6
MTAPGQLRQCLRMLLLPISVEREAACGRVLLARFRALGLARADFRDWIELHLGNWKDEGTPSVRLALLVKAVLLEANSDTSPPLAEKYFLVHQRLMSDHLMSHQEARTFLSSAFLMVDLARRELFSAAQISKLVERRDGRVHFSRQAVTLLIDSVGLKRELSLGEVSRLYTKDQNLELSTFADADIETAVELVADEAISLGFSDQIRDALCILAPSANLAAFPAYLQVLHYQCMIAEFYDHAVTDLYEFSPRGLAAGWLFNAYPTSLVSAGNPFLNNMKSVGRIDSMWARSKKQGELPGATSLLRILVGLEAMSFAARRELARLIRLWIHRVMRLSVPLTVVLPPQLTPHQIARLLDHVGRGNTGTYGVIEQRIVDAIAAQKHLRANGWRARGLADSVHATNVSRRKIGDCDFQHPTQLRIAAYEAHGGELTDVYVDEHLRTLKKVMAMRVEELGGIADITLWTASITFVAHQISSSARESIEVEGVLVSLHFVSFADFIESALDSSGVAPDWQQWLVEPISQRRTPLEARRTLLAFVEE